MGKIAAKGCGHVLGSSLGTPRSERSALRFIAEADVQSCWGDVKLKKFDGRRADAPEDSSDSPDYKVFCDRT